MKQCVYKCFSNFFLSFCNRYDEIFDGVILAYEIDIPGEHAKILSGLIPYLGVKVKANLLIFSPRPDMLLGKSYHVTNHSILCLYVLCLNMLYYRFSLNIILSSSLSHSLRK